MRIENYLGEGNYTMLNKPLAREIGIGQAVFLCELISQRTRFKQDEFYFTQSDMEKEIGLSESTQLRYSKELKEKGLINVEKKGIPARNRYSINDNNIHSIIMGETCAVNLTELEQSDGPNYSNNKENKKDNNIIINNNTELLDNSEFLENNNSLSINNLDLKEKEKSCAKKEKENGNKDINNLISEIKNVCNSLGIMYSNSMERQFAKHILTAKEFGENAEKCNMDRIKFALSIIYMSIQIKYFKGACNGPKSIYQNYADIYNQYKQKAMKTITPTINVL